MQLQCSIVVIYKHAILPAARLCPETFVFVVLILHLCFCQLLTMVPGQVLTAQQLGGLQPDMLLFPALKQHHPTPTATGRTQSTAAQSAAQLHITACSVPNSAYFGMKTPRACTAARFLDISAGGANHCQDEQLAGGG